MQILTQYQQVFANAYQILKEYNDNLRNELFEIEPNEDQNNAYKRGERIFDQYEDDLKNITELIKKEKEVNEFFAKCKENKQKLIQHKNELINIDLLKKVDSLIIESNHDVEMLMNSNRPWYLKNRILSIKGHMSNKICGEVLNQVIEANNLKKIILAHLSEECNTEELAVDTVLENINSENIPEMYVAKQWVALPLLEV